VIAKKSEVLTYLQKAGSITAADEALFDLIHGLSESALKSFMQQTLGFEQHVEYYPQGQPQLEDDYPLEDVQFRSAGATFVNGRAGTEFLQLKHLPVALTGIEVREDVGGHAGQTDDSFGDDTVLTLGDDYFLDLDDHSNSLSRTGILYRVGAWPAEPRSVRVSYYAGFSASQLANDAIAGAVKLAAIKTTAAYFWQAKTWATNNGSGPKTSEQIGKYGYSSSQAFAASAGLIGSDVPPDAKALLQPFRNYGRCFG
jgi:hypothetical protein